ncbi:MAG: heavy metal translocating P-type ATPase [Candidatus Aenigmatarchaeota archaeon]|nr:MAG: heavy metal translocating P-type ATPase [Candidatus Aenigmarchaeota archaeon]
MSKKSAKKKTASDEIIRIKGMTCKSCVENIESGVGSMAGVKDVKVSLTEDSAFVRFDPSITNLNSIKKKISSLGYSTGNYKAEKKQTTFLQGVSYALLPHVGCIAFIAGSILGVTLLMEFFRPLLMNRWFFHILVLISIGFATLSSALYLKRNSLLSMAGAKRKWQYLSTMYGSTVGINLVLFLVIFPLLANVSTVSAAGVTGAAIASGDFSELDEGDAYIQLAVDIPCPGHAPLITEELKTTGGISAIQFSFPNVFDVVYDSAKTSKEGMLSLEVFEEYPATVLDESTSQDAIKEIQQKPSYTATGGSCCGGSSCAGPTGGCGCGGW